MHLLAPELAGGRALALDAQLVPLYRKMARFADASVAGTRMTEEEMARNPFE